MQPALPVWSWNWPAEHVPQLVLPVVPCFQPTGQILHPLYPSLFVYHPVGQFLQLCLLCSFWNWPAAHR